MGNDKGKKTTGSKARHSKAKVIKYGKREFKAWRFRGWLYVYVPGAGVVQGNPDSDVFKARLALAVYGSEAKTAMAGKLIRRLVGKL